MPKITRSELLQKLNDATVDDDPEREHLLADQALLDYIDDSEVTEAFNAGTKWYA